MVIAAEYPGVHAFLEAVLAPGIKLAGRFAMLWKIALVCVVAAGADAVWASVTGRG